MNQLLATSGGCWCTSIRQQAARDQRATRRPRQLS